MAGNYGGGYYRRPILPPQRETKEYTLLSEVGIPAIQAAIVVWLCDVLAGLLLYIIVYIGPVTISTVLGGVILIGTAGVVGFTRIGYQVKAPAVTVGVLVFAIQQYAFVKLAAVWPWDWKEPLTMWHAWVHTLWLGPLVGGGVLIWRFIHEVLDPFWPRIPMYPEEPKQRRQLPVYDRKMVITKHVNDKSAAVEEPPVIEETWIPPERETPLKGHLIAFLQACDKRGTSRADWLPRGQKYHLNTGLRVTRTVYDDLMSTLCGIGIYRRVGTGRGLKRLCKLQEAIDLVEEKVDDEESWA